MPLDEGKIYYIYIFSLLHDVGKKFCHVQDQNVSCRCTLVNIFPIFFGKEYLPYEIIIHNSSRDNSYEIMPQKSLTTLKSAVVMIMSAFE